MQAFGESTKERKHDRSHLVGERCQKGEGAAELTPQVIVIAKLGF